MVEDSDVLEKLKLFTDMQQSEARLHWSRNSFFSVVASILLLALSQFRMKEFQFLIGVLGFVLSVAWVFIQDRSSKYIQYWKNEAQKLASSAKAPSIYPENLGGVEMRKVAYVLPLAFLIIWFAVMCFVLLIKSS